MDYVGTTCQQYDMGGLTMCNNCIHKAVCSIYRATGGVKKCEHHREERKGECIEDGYTNTPCVCSHCGGEAHYTSTFQEQFDYDWEENLVSTGYEEIREYIRSNYCPYCGADMRGAEDGN